MKKRVRKQKSKLPFLDQLLAPAVKPRKPLRVANHSPVMVVKNWRKMEAFYYRSLGLAPKA